MTPILMIHIAAGAVSLLSGAGAMVARKGSPLHGRIGTVFVAAMLVMTSTGAMIAAFRPERITTLVGVTTGYLVTTSWLAARGGGLPGFGERMALPVILSVTTAQFAFAFHAARSATGLVDSLPYQAGIAFGALALWAGLLDIRFLRLGRLPARARIARHLWRMSAALFIAATSFFNGQRDELPAAWQDLPIWNLPSLAVLGAMSFWLVKLRIVSRRG